MQVDPSSRSGEYDALLAQCIGPCALAFVDAFSHQHLVACLGARQAAAAALVCAHTYVPLLRLMDWQLTGTPAALCAALRRPVHDLPPPLRVAGSAFSDFATRALAEAERTAAAAKHAYATGDVCAALYLWRSAFQRLQAWQAGPEGEQGLLQLCAHNIGEGARKVPHQPERLFSVDRVGPALRCAA